MANGRMFAASFQNVSVSAVQDLFSIKCAAAVPIWVHQVNINQITQTTIGALRIRLRYLPATVTQGSGGSVPTSVGTDPAGKAAAAASTVHANDTTQATSGGTILDLFDDAWQLLNGWLWVPPDPQDRLFIKPSDAIVCSLDTAPGSALTCSGTINFEELG